MITGTYQFRYKRGGALPYQSLVANGDEDFWNRVLPDWEKLTGFKHHYGSVTCTISETRKVAEPPRMASMSIEDDRTALARAAERSYDLPTQSLALKPGDFT